MFDLIRGDHCNNTELEHFPSFYFPQEIYKKKSQNLYKQGSAIFDFDK